MGFLGRLLGKKEHPAHKLMRDEKKNERKRFEAQLKTAEEKAFRKARLKRATKEGKARGDKKPVGFLERLGGSLEQFGKTTNTANRVLFGDLNQSPGLKKQTKKKAPSGIGGTVINVFPPGTEPNKKGKKDDDPLSYLM